MTSMPTRSKTMQRLARLVEQQHEVCSAEIVRRRAAMERLAAERAAIEALLAAPTDQLWLAATLRHVETLDQQTREQERAATIAAARLRRLDLRTQFLGKQLRDVHAVEQGRATMRDLDVWLSLARGNDADGSDSRLCDPDIDPE
jgi:hypothetical protein